MIISLYLSIYLSIYRGYKKCFILFSRLLFNKTWRPHPPGIPWVMVTMVLLGLVRCGSVAPSHVWVSEGALLWKKYHAWWHGIHHDVYYISYIIYILYYIYYIIYMMLIIYMYICTLYVRVYLWMKSFIIIMQINWVIERCFPVTG